MVPSGDITCQTGAGSGGACKAFALGLVRMLDAAFHDPANGQIPVDELLACAEATSGDYGMLAPK